LALAWDRLVGLEVEVNFYPPNALVPQELRTTRLWLRPLRVTDVALDYEAVMSSAEMLHCWSQGDWPATDFTIGQNLADLEWHELKHTGREAFTFTVLDPAGRRCLGCVYIQPLLPVQFPLCKGAACAADVGFWVRQSELEAGLERHLWETISDWFKDEWAFECILYTLCQQETRQAALFAAAGLERLSACTLPDGRQCWVYGEACTAHP
jgi:hypothetical protein